MKKPSRRLIHCMNKAVFQYLDITVAHVYVAIKIQAMPWNLSLQIILKFFFWETQIVLWVSFCWWNIKPFNLRLLQCSGNVSKLQNSSYEFNLYCHKKWTREIKLYDCSPTTRIAVSNKEAYYKRNFVPFLFYYSRLRMENFLNQMSQILKLSASISQNIRELLQ